MDNDLLDIYEQHYLGTAPVINESAPSFEVEDDEAPEIVEEAKKKSNFKKKFKKKEGGKAEFKPGMYADGTSFDNLFDKIIKEEFGEDDAGIGDDSSFSDEDSYEFGDDEGGDEQISVSRATLQSIMDQIQGLLGDDVGGEEEFDAQVSDDEIPQESYAFSGDGKEHGMQGQYDGKAKKQGKSNLVKDNGDVEFGKQDTGFDPEDTEGSEGAEHGMQGQYDGKAKTQGKTNLVKDNGDIDKSKQKTSYKTGSGKKDKNLF